jgi:hypothetical protein
LDDIVRLREHIEQHGSVVPEPIATAAGRIVGERMVPNPAVRMLRDAERQHERWLAALAIPPGHRAGLGVMQVKAESKLEQLITSREQRRTQ